VLKTDSEPAVREYFHDSLLNFFANDMHGKTVESNREGVLMYRESHRVRPEEMGRVLEEAVQLYAHLVIGDA
jgi:hypothetical protein